MSFLKDLALKEAFFALRARDFLTWRFGIGFAAKDLRGTSCGCIDKTPRRSLRDLSEANNNDADNQLLSFEPLPSELYDREIVDNLMAIKERKDQELKKKLADTRNNIMESFGGDDIATIASDLISSMSSIVPENSLLSTKCCIFATPKLLLKDNEKSYLPTAFAIGPVHHGKPDLQEAEQIKLKYTRDLIVRVSQWNDTIVKDLVEEIASLEEQARQYYAVPVKFNKAKFVKLLLVDGCFIIELFRKKLGDSPIYEADPVYGRPFLREVLGTDLLLLENQIPWMVLDRLFSSTTRTGASPLTRVTLFFFSFLGTGGLDLQTENSFMPSTLDQSKHVLELLRNSLVWSTIPEGGVLDTWELIPSASSLMEAGVKFKKGSTSNGLLDIKFSNGVLEIPPLVIVEPTKAFFRSLVSYEQCYHWCHPKITSHAMFLDLLINTSKDMDILCKNGIIQNWLNPEDATQIFNNLYNDANVSHFYYLELCREVNKYCKRRWPRWRAMYVRNHFSSPWAIASQVLAAIIFIFTLLQTVFSIKS